MNELKRENKIYLVPGNNYVPNKTTEIKIKRRKDIVNGMTNLSSNGKFSKSVIPKQGFF